MTMIIFQIVFINSFQVVLCKSVSSISKQSDTDIKHLVEAPCNLKCRVASFTLCYNKAHEGFRVFFMETLIPQCKPW